MIIKVFGRGRIRSQLTEEMVNQAVVECDIAASVKFVTDTKQMVKHGAFITPVVVIDDKIISAGRIPELEDLKNVLIKKMEPSLAMCG